MPLAGYEVQVLLGLVELAVHAAAAHGVVLVDGVLQHVRIDAQLFGQLRYSGGLKVGLIALLHSLRSLTLEGQESLGGMYDVHDVRAVLLVLFQNALVP